MPSMQKLQLIGHLGGDPEVRYTPSGAAVCNFSVATSEKWKDKQTGEMQERTEWHKCEVWGKSAERAAEWLYKGCLVYVEGKLQTDKWQDQQGADRYTTKVRVWQWDNLSPRREGQQQRPSQQQGGQNSGPTTEPVLDDDIPF